MKSINPYLNFKDKTEEAFNFYKSVLGGEFTMLQRFKDMPPGSGDVAESERELILHVSLVLNNGIVIMGSDAPEAHGLKVITGNNVHMMINAESEAEAETIFKGLSDGGKVTMPLQKMFWGALYASFADKFGVNWMINYDLQPRPLETGF
ncbi:MAG TPA: VOC family protein [Methanomassiliicoccales archaeon]|jgi:PhnB protein